VYGPIKHQLTILEREFLSEDAICTAVCPDCWILYHRENFVVTWLHNYLGHLDHQEMFLENSWVCDHSDKWVSELDIKLEEHEEKLKGDIMELEMKKRTFLFEGTEFQTFDD
jgi:hypothetical protein